MQKQVKTVSIVIPFLNEEKTASVFFEKLANTIDKIDYLFEIIAVNDGSIDNTSAILNKLVKEDKRIKAIHLSRNFGQQAALTAGMDKSTGEAIICMDGDLQHPVSLIAEMLNEWENGYDIVYTVRVKESKKSFKSFTSSLFYKVINKISDIKINENAADFRLISRKICNILKCDIRERNRFLRGLVSWVGFKSKKIEFKADPRVGGETKYSLVKMFQLASSGIVSFTTFPLKAAIYCGMLFAFLSSCFGIYAVCIVMFTNSAVHGWASILCAVTFIGSLQFIFIGVIGEYIAYMFDEIKGRPIYIIEEIVGEEK